MYSMYLSYRNAAPLDREVVTKSDQENDKERSEREGLEGEGSDQRDTV